MSAGLRYLAVASSDSFWLIISSYRRRTMSLLRMARLSLLFTSSIMANPFRWRLFLIKTGKFQPERVQFGIRFFTDESENLFRVLTHRCPNWRWHLFCQFDHPRGGRD